MDLSGVTVEDAAPLMQSIEEALEKPEVEQVWLVDSAKDAEPLRFSRAQAEQLLHSLERQFFGTVH